MCADVQDYKYTKGINALGRIPGSEEGLHNHGEG